jgi:curved DNA-binding protein
VEFKDYYKVMGVARDATEAQIKQAYRKLARKYHPDVSKEKDAEARFKEVGEAYEVLKSPEKRAAYDQLGQGHPPARISARLRIGAPAFEFSGAGGPGFAPTATFSSRCSARKAALNPAGGRRRISDRGEDHHAKVHAGSGGHAQRRRAAASPCACPKSMPRAGWSNKERVLNVQVPKGILPGSRFGWRARVRGFRWRQARRSVHRSGISAAPLVSSRWPGFVSRAAGRSLGGGTRRHGEDAHAGRRGGIENSRRLACRQ